MNTETEQFLVIDIAAAQDLAAKNPLSAMDARDKFKDVLRLETVNEEVLEQEIQKIHEKYTQAAAGAINDYKAAKDKLDELKKTLEDNTSEIEKIRAQRTALSEINTAYRKLIIVLPQEAKGHITEKLSTGMLSDDELIKEVKSKLGLFKKWQLKTDPILVAYDNLTRAMNNSGYNAVPSYANEDKRLEGILAYPEKAQKAQKEDVKKQTDEVEKQKAELAKYSVPMNTEIGQLLVAVNDTTTQDYIEAINPSINMENLTEPVAFFQRLDLKNIEDVYRVIELLQKVGLKAAMGANNDPTEYIVRYPQRKDSFIELITPFYSPEKAHTNITALAKYLARNGVNIAGVIHPTTLKQLDPRISVGYTKTMSEHDVACKIREKLKKAETRKNLIKQFGAHSDDFLFRGQNFITSDPASSYATLTWRPGRTGLAYATDDISYAFSYSGGTDTESMANGTTDPQYLDTIWGKMPVGFVTIYRRSPKNKMLSNLELEGGSFRFPGEFEKSAVATQYNETAVNPHDNPIVARYLVSGAQCVKVDENDPEWHQILDYFSPFLEVTHQSGLGRRFVEKLNELRKQADANDGLVETHDLTEDQLEAMRMKREQFEDAKKKLIDKYQQGPVRPHQMDAYRD